MPAGWSWDVKYRQSEWGKERGEKCVKNQERVCLMCAACWK